MKQIFNLLPNHVYRIKSKISVTAIEIHIVRFETHKEYNSVMNGASYVKYTHHRKKYVARVINNMFKSPDFKIYDKTVFFIMPDVKISKSAEKKQIERGTDRRRRVQKEEEEKNTQKPLFIKIGLLSKYRCDRTKNILKYLSDYPCNIKYICPFLDKSFNQIRDFDLLWTLYPFKDGIFALHAKEKYGIPYVITMRGQFWHMQPKQVVDNAVEVYKNADFIITLAYQQYHNLINRYPIIERIPKIKIPNGNFFDAIKKTPEFNLSKIGIKRRTKRLVVFITNFGFADKRKAVDEIADAWNNSLELIGNNTILVIGGDGYYAPDSDIYTNNTDSIKYIGNVNNAIGLIKQADVFLYNSYIDGQASVIMEALSAGIPCVVGNRCGADEIITDRETGMLFDTPEDGIKTVVKLLHNDELRKKLSENAIMSMRYKFDWNDIARRYYEIFYNITRKNNVKP